MGRLAPVCETCPGDRSCEADTGFLKLCYEGCGRKAGLTACRKELARRVDQRNIFKKAEDIGAGTLQCCPLQWLGRYVARIAGECGEPRKPTCSVTCCENTSLRVPYQLVSERGLWLWPVMARHSTERVGSARKQMVRGVEFKLGGLSPVCITSTVVGQPLGFGE